MPSLAGGGGGRVGHHGRGCRSGDQGTRGCYMDFAPERMRETGGLPVRPLRAADPALLPPAYLGYSTEQGEPTECSTTTSAPVQPGRASGGAAMAAAPPGGQRGSDPGARRRAVGPADARELRAAALESTGCRRGSAHGRGGRQAGASANFAGSGGRSSAFYRDERVPGPGEALGGIAARSSNHSATLDTNRPTRVAAGAVENGQGCGALLEKNPRGSLP